MSNTLSLPFRQEPSFLPLRDSDSDIRCDECSTGASSESRGSKERRKLNGGGNMEVQQKIHLRVLVRQ